MLGHIHSSISVQQRPTHLAIKIWFVIAQNEFKINLRYLNLEILSH
jgi:hypothetical protein